MATAAELQAQLDTLKRARASGTLRVSDGTRTIEYRSMDELERAIGAVALELARANGNVPARVMRSMTAKGV